MIFGSSEVVAGVEAEGEVSLGAVALGAPVLVERAMGAGGGCWVAGAGGGGAAEETREGVMVAGGVKKVPSSRVSRKSLE